MIETFHSRSSSYSDSDVGSHSLWDLAGVDGLAVMQELFGAAIDRIAPFQSLETELDRIPCSILRLCEHNFRIGWSGAPEVLQAQLAAVTRDRGVWVKQFPWLSRLLLPETLPLDRLAQVATPKPPFRLSTLALHCAAPVRIEGIAVLVWRHPVQGQDCLELHVAQESLARIRALLIGTD